MITITLKTRRAVVAASYIAPPMLLFLSWWIGRYHQEANYWLIIAALVGMGLSWRVCFDMMQGDMCDDGEAGK